MKEKVAVVTGGAGFIGSHLVDLLLEEGFVVRAVDSLACGRMSNLEKASKNASFSFHQVDIRNPEELKEPFRGVDFVFHLAGLADVVPSIEKPQDYYSTNVTGTFNVLQASREAKAKKFVYAASSSCYGLVEQFPTPESAPIDTKYPYALTKYLGEELVMHWNHVYHLPAISLRLFNVYGPRSRTTGAYGAVFGVFLTQKLYGEAFTVVGDGEQTRDFTYVRDVANAFYTASQSDVFGEIFNVGSGATQSVNRLVELLGGEKVHIPKRPGEPDCTFAETKKIESMLGWKAKVPFEEGVAEMLKHIDDYRDAPLWSEESIEEVTKPWFAALGGV